MYVVDLCDVRKRKRGRGGTEGEGGQRGERRVAELFIRCSGYYFFFDFPSVQVTVIPSQRISFPSSMLSYPTHVSMVSCSCPDAVLF